ncbi:MAG: metallophosphoesterase [Lachnospiraceae bacterium]|nr:metallophosphoesterase [Lachnospiraceae bacterium]MBQ5485051.1 metallophosphoesterase [Lachnospiraceae bacterium]
MRVLVVSDSHGRVGELQKAYEKVKPELILHLGDSQLHLSELSELFGCEVIGVRGNCDYDTRLPKTQEVTIGSHKVFMTHGHLYDVGFDLFTLVDAAKEHGCDVALFGHTHVPELLTMEGVTVCNPGSIAQPRQQGHEYTYAVIDVDPVGDLHFKHMCL